MSSISQVSQVMGRAPTRQSNKNLPGQSTLSYYQNETKKFEKGKETAKNILKDVKLMNMKLDDITDLVRLQRQKLLNMHKQIEQSQNYMNRSKKIIRGFSKELYGDKIISTLVALIATIIIFIVIAAIKYKMKSDILISNDSDHVISENDYSIIDEKIFWKSSVSEERLKNFVKKDFEGQESLKNYVINERMQKVEAEIMSIELDPDEVKIIKTTLSETEHAEVKEVKAPISDDGTDQTTTPAQNLAAQETQRAADQMVSQEGTQSGDRVSPGTTSVSEGQSKELESKEDEHSPVNANAVRQDKAESSEISKETRVDDEAREQELAKDNQANVKISDDQPEKREIDEDQVIKQESAENSLVEQDTDTGKAIQTATLEDNLVEQEISGDTQSMKETVEQSVRQETLDQESVKQETLDQQSVRQEIIDDKSAEQELAESKVVPEEIKYEEEKSPKIIEEDLTRVETENKSEVSKKESEDKVVPVDSETEQRQGITEGILGQVQKQANQVAEEYKPVTVDADSKSAESELMESEEISSESNVVNHEADKKDTFI